MVDYYYINITYLYITFNMSVIIYQKTTLSAAIDYLHYGVVVAA